MKSLTQFLSERFINLLPNDEEKKREHASHVHAMLTKAYADQGGLHGKGFSSPEDMVKNIPMWKLHKKNGKVVAASFYKDTGGRKKVAMATDGSDEGREGAAQMLRDDLLHKRSYGEVSGRALSFHKKHIKDFHKFVLTKEQVKKISKHEISDVDDNDPEVKRHPELKNHFYSRDINGTRHTKVMIGTPGKKII